MKVQNSQIMRWQVSLFIGPLSRFILVLSTYCTYTLNLYAICNAISFVIEIKIIFISLSGSLLYIQKIQNRTETV